MLFTRIAFSFLLASFVHVAACGGTADEPVDLSDPGFLPTGTYDLRITDASCNVNGSFQGSPRVALFRNGPGKPPTVNIPLPTKLESAADGASVSGSPRQDLELATGHVAFDREDGERCGNVTISADITDLSANRIGITYRETPAEGCSVPACSVEYAFELVEAACPRDCNSTGATLYANGGGSMIWRCDCQ